MPSSPTMPVWVGVSLSHAALQGACEQVGARALHIKGPALVDALVAPWVAFPRARAWTPISG